MCARASTSAAQLPLQLAHAAEAVLACQLKAQQDYHALLQGGRKHLKPRPVPAVAPTTRCGRLLQMSPSVPAQQTKLCFSTLPQMSKVTDGALPQPAAANAAVPADGAALHIVLLLSAKVSTIACAQKLCQGISLTMTAVLGASGRKVGGIRQHLVGEAHQVLLSPAATRV